MLLSIGLIKLNSINFIQTSCALKSKCKQHAQERRDEWKWLREILSSFHTLSTYKIDKYQNETRNETCRQNCGTSINAREKRSLASMKKAKRSKAKKEYVSFDCFVCARRLPKCAAFSSFGHVVILTNPIKFFLGYIFQMI